MIRRALGWLLLAASLAQSADLPGFARAIGAYRLGPAEPVAVALVVAELVAGVALLERDKRARRSGARIAFAAAAAWTLAGVVALARDLPVRNAGWLGTWAEQRLSPVALVLPVLVWYAAWRVLRRGRGRIEW